MIISLGICRNFLLHDAKYYGKDFSLGHIQPGCRWVRPDGTKVFPDIRMAVKTQREV